MISGIFSHKAMNRRDSGCLLPRSIPNIAILQLDGNSTPLNGTWSCRRQIPTETCPLVDPITTPTDKVPVPICSLQPNRIKTCPRGLPHLRAFIKSLVSCLSLTKGKIFGLYVKAKSKYTGKRTTAIRSGIHHGSLQLNGHVPDAAALHIHYL